VVVQDDGVGVVSMDDRGTGLGLEHLREECGLRGGGLVLGANDDGGATLRAWISVGA
jgi:glucose-6-phosphate-specific signal transduction histidine kinase